MLNLLIFDYLMLDCDWANGLMSIGGLETILIGNIVDGEVFTDLLINPTEVAVHNNGLVFGANLPSSDLGLDCAIRDL